MFENISVGIKLYKEKVGKWMMPKTRVKAEKNWDLNLENDKSTRKIDVV